MLFDIGFNLFFLMYRGLVNYVFTSLSDGYKNSW